MLKSRAQVLKRTSGAVFDSDSFDTNSFDTNSFDFGTVVLETVKDGLSKLGLEITEEEIFAAVIAALTVIS